MSPFQIMPMVNPAVVWTKLPDGAVLFSPETELYYSMNHVGGLIWELLPESGRGMDALCSAVQERFPGEPLDQIKADAEELLIELARNGLVIVSEAA